MNLKLFTKVGHHNIIGIKNPSGDYPAYVIPVVSILGEPKFVFTYDETTLNYYDLRDTDTWEEIFIPEVDLLNGFLFSKNKNTVEYIKNDNEIAFIKKLLHRRQLHNCQVPSFKKRLDQLEN